MLRWNPSTVEKPCDATVGHGSETPNPQQDSSPRRCQKRAHRCSRNSIFGTAKARQYKANIPVQAIQGIESRPRCLDEPEYRGKALWSTVEHGYETPDPQQDSSPRRCQKRAQPLNTRQYKVQSNLQGIQGIEGKAIRCLDEPEYRGNALWSTVGHGCETPDPQQDSSPRRCQKRAQRWQGNTRHTRHTWQSHRCLDGPASTMEKPWLGNTGCPAGFKPKTAPEACAEMLSK